VVVASPRPKIRATKPAEATALADPFGYDPALHARVRPVAEFFYRRYWRVSVDGLENVPDSGPALLVGNHSGGIPVDAAMIVAAVDLEHPQHRLVRFLYDAFVAKMPVVGEFYSRMGSVVASLDNARRLLENGDLVGIFPEGVQGVAKGIGRRYHVQGFHTGFVRLSLQQRVPIIPTAVVGAEEIYPVIGKWERLGPLKDILNVPYVPLTPLFPWFGLLGLVPLPTRWQIRFGTPLRLYEERSAQQNPTTRTVRAMAERVRRRIQGMLHELLAERESIF
jgi:1-acyl-sn-glycerol-3-phosphate acyltransferase